MSGRTCGAKTKRGEPCGMAPLQGSKWCWNHDPDKARERSKARKLGGYNRRPTKAEAPQQVALRDVAAVQFILELAMQDTLALENSVARSRTLGYLAGQALKVLEVGELEERLEVLESLLSMEKGIDSSGG